MADPGSSAFCYHNNAKFKKKKNPKTSVASNDKHLLPTRLDSELCWYWLDSLWSGCGLTEPGPGGVVQADSALTTPVSSCSSQVATGKEAKLGTRVSDSWAKLLTSTILPPKYNTKC